MRGGKRYGVPAVYWAVYCRYTAGKRYCKRADAKFFGVLDDLGPRAKPHHQGYPVEPHPPRPVALHPILQQHPYNLPKTNPTSRAISFTCWRSSGGMPRTEKTSSFLGGFGRREAGASFASFARTSASLDRPAPPADFLSPGPSAAGAPPPRTGRPPGKPFSWAARTATSYTRAHRNGADAYPPAGLEGTAGRTCWRRRPCAGSERSETITIAYGDSAAASFRVGSKTPGGAPRCG